jgi:O-antigen/teichoic acid export membrane protein
MMARLLRGVGANAFERIVIAVSQIVMVPILATHWGLRVYSLWVLLATLPGFMVFSDFGLGVAAGTRMTMQVATGNRQGAARTFQNAWATMLPLALVLVIVALAAIWTVPDRYFAEAPMLRHHESRWVMTLLILYGVSCLQGNMLLAGFRSIGRFSTGALAQALMFLAETIGVVLLVLGGGGPRATAICYLAVRLIGLGVTGFLLLHLAPWLRPRRDLSSMGEMRFLTRPAMAAMALPVAQGLFLQGTAVALGMAAGPAAVPAFTTVRTLSRLGLQAIALLYNAVIPEFSLATANDDHAARARIVMLTLLVSSALIVPFALVLAIAGTTIVDIWTNHLIHPTPALMLFMALSALIAGFWTPISMLLLAMNRHANFTYAYLGLAVLSVGITYLLGSRIGSVAGGVAFFLLDAAMALVILRLAGELGLSRADLAKGAASLMRMTGLRRLLPRG